MLADAENEQLRNARLTAIGVRRLRSQRMLFRMQWAVTTDPVLEENGLLDLESLQEAARHLVLPGYVRAIRLASGLDAQLP